MRLPRRLLIKASSALDTWIGWDRLPRPLGLLTVAGLREQLRDENLTDTRLVREAPAEPSDLAVRTLDGSWNDLGSPAMGSVGTRFGRNVPLDRAYPDRGDDFLEPSPRAVAERFLDRPAFIPAPTLNLLAAAWIQFEVHDWLSHSTDEEHAIRVPLAKGDAWPHDPMTVPATVPDGASDGGPPVYRTSDSHWWDGSQIYGLDEDFQSEVRTGEDGKLAVDEHGLPPAALDPMLDPAGPRGNFWLGLALLHGLFMREHNAICDALRQEPRRGGWTDQSLYDTARLVNAAVMAKIHTVEWTPAIIAHPTTKWGMNANWYGLAGERVHRRFGRLGRSDVLSGIPGSPTDHHGAPYSLTEEFVAVYRMHALIPDEFGFRSLRNGGGITEVEFAAIGPGRWRDPLLEIGLPEAVYSFGTSPPGAIAVHNFPTSFRALRADVDGPPIDLATIDVLRDRERGVPRYNEFRALVHKKPAASFEDLARNPAVARELRDVYGHVDRVDTMIGLYAEPRPRGFGFSDTAFRVFLLMASRRLESDRFFTVDYRPEVYTPAGLRWIEDATMSGILLRHHPELGAALQRVENAFQPWPGG
jgi:hypothetical protein